MRETSASAMEAKKAAAQPQGERPAHLLTGERGEEAATRFLQNKGYTIIDRNVREGHCEIDIVARDEDELVFAEVRTRTENKLMAAEETVGPRKLSRLIKAGRLWVEKAGYEGFWRIDIVAVTIDGENSTKLEHFISVTEPII